MAIGGSGRVYLGFLGKLGVDREQIDQLRKQLNDSDTSASQLEKVDVYGRVRLSDLDRYTEKFQLPLARLRSILATPKTPPIKVGHSDADFPTVRVRDGQTRTFDENMAARPVKTGELPHSGMLEQFLEKLKLDPPVDYKEQGIDADRLVELMNKHRHTARTVLTTDAFEQIKARLYSLRGPAHTEHDVHLNLDSKLQLLSEGKGAADGVKVYKKDLLEHLFLRRQEDGQTFELHGFQGQRVSVEAPLGCTVFLVDSEGNHRALNLTPTKGTLDDGTDVRTYDISPSMIRPWDGERQNPSFTLKVLDKAQTPVFEQNFQFDGNVGQRSQKLFTGKLGYTPKPEPKQGELSDEHFNYFVPSPKSNKAPVGERPQFRVTDDGKPADQLLIERDGATFAVNRLVQFGCPPKAKQQAFKVGNQAFLLDHRGTNSSHLDDPSYDPTAGFKIRSSRGFGCTFDRQLDQSAQLRWGFKGVEVFGSNVGKEPIVFDPLAPETKAKS